MDQYGNRYQYGSGYDTGNSGRYGRSSDQYYNTRYEEYRNPGYRQDMDYNRNERYRNRENDRNWWDKTTDEVSSWFGDEEAKRRRRMDELNEGMHKGKGPKNYTRSSEKIREDVCEMLSQDSHVDASDIDVAVKGTEVTLTGTVESRMAKRRAEDLAERVSGISHVQNNLRVNEQRYWQDSRAAENLRTSDSRFSRNANKEQIV
jgi:osmotically-inducible protein OsmY